MSLSSRRFVFTCAVALPSIFLIAVFGCAAWGCLPNENVEFVKLIEFGRVIPDVTEFSNRSQFPLATTLGYLTALGGSLVIGSLGFCFSSQQGAPIARFIVQKSVASRFVYVLSALLMAGYPYVLAISASEGAIMRPILMAVSRNPFAAYLWFQFFLFGWACVYIFIFLLAKTFISKE